MNIFTKAVKQYAKYYGANEWNVPVGTGLINACFNCEDNHPGGFYKFSKPNFEARIENTKKKLKIKKGPKAKVEQ